MTRSLLAIEGGTPVRKAPWQVPRRADEQTQQAIFAALKADNWSNGEHVSMFEQAFGKFLGCENVVMTVNATYALKLALLSWDIGPGDEVIVPALTFPSVAMAVLECGAVPVVCDVDPESWCMSVDTIRPALSPRTRVLLPTHLYCTQCDMPPILELARQRSLMVIEDCAHVPGTRRHDRCAGAWGHAAIFSFNQKKPLACGEGGCLVTNDRTFYERVRRLRAFDTPCPEPPRRLQRMGKVSEFQAAVLIGQLASLADRLRITEEHAESLRGRLEQLSGVHVLPRLTGTRLQTFYNFCLRITGLTDAQACRRALSAEIGLPMATTYLPLDIDPALNCSRERQFGSHSLRTSGACVAAHWAFHHEAVRFPGQFLYADATAIEDIATAMAKVLPHFVKQSTE